MVAGLHALVFLWAGSKLPWSDWSGFAIVCTLLALAHLLTAGLAALGHRWLTPVWRGASVLALVVFGWLSWELTSAASYLAGLYGELGEGLGAALMAVIGLVAVLTVPLSAWGLAATWRRSFNRGAGTAALVLATIWSVGALRQAADARAEPLATPADPNAESSLDLAAQFDAVEQDLRAALEAELPSLDELPEIPGRARPRARARRKVSLFTEQPVACVPDPSDSRASAVVTFMAPDPERGEGGRLLPASPISVCVRAPPEELAGAIVHRIREQAYRAPIKIDVLRGVDPLRSRMPALDALALRPGLDGVCDEQVCLMPWQLVATNQFVLNEPAPWIPDFRFGLSAVSLRQALGHEVPEQVILYDRQRRKPKARERAIEAGELATPPADDSLLRLDGLTRLETFSFVIQPSQTEAPKLIPLIRLHERKVELTRERLERARDTAELHIARAQLKVGRFRYILDPFTGRQRTRSWNLPRQAGTTLVMCEQGRNPRRVRRVAERSLAYMADHARSSGDRVGLIRKRGSNVVHLGSTALPAIAFAACRPHVGRRHDGLIGGLARMLIAMQREDGSYYPKFDVASGEPIDGPEPMYAGGQVIFALSLFEKIALDEPEVAAAAGIPSAAELHEAVEKGMNHYAGPYWDNFLRDFFWLEENWHCLAARASLEHHRNEAYEQFCLDYMSYKARVPLTEDSGVAPEFFGGYSLGNILVPINTPAAGFGEGMAAAIAIKEARGEDTRAEREQMKQVLTFLVRQQWNDDTCFACAPHRPVVGGFSESMGAAEIRIDYTQHAWAALGHGGRWIEDELPGAG